MENSSTDKYKDGSYQAKNPSLHREDSTWKAEKVTVMLQKHGIKPAKILEVGTGAGVILDELSKMNRGIDELSGFDISPYAIAEAKKIDNRKLSFHVGELPTEIRADLILMLDVIEHVDDFYSFLRGMLNQAQYFIFHIPLDLSCRTLLKPHIIKQQRQDVGHIHYFSKEMVLWAMEDTGYHVVDWEYTRPVTDIQASPTIFRAIKKSLRNLSFGINPDTSAKLWGGYSMLMLLKKAG